ncbi:helix-turn-helix transcriptional regulator [Nocardia otitidiscaviarum]|nr:helix-turn-helix transcriptional regulator [Nocardia otitidiscaviarum]MBF6241564.1 helix-turn-helix transcriptional regulator [Nocardia otitidiscaviarum]MBF6483182.1 helix-turn-helix transcriptional regulator [Nocardia otitidiscaviarum]
MESRSNIVSAEAEPRNGGGGEELTPRQLAASVFSKRLAELVAESVVSTEDDGPVRSLTLYSLAQHLELAYPDVPISQSGLYRLIHGEAIPRLDLIVALARVFDVAPEYFITEPNQ